MRAWRTLTTLGVVCIVGACSGDDRAERFITEVTSPYAVVAVDDRVWVAAGDASAELVEVDLDEPAVTTRMPLPALPQGVYVLDGVVWTTSARGASPVGVSRTESVTSDIDLMHDSLALVDGRVFAVRNGNLYELDPETGDELGQVPLPRRDTGGEQVVLPTPLVADGSSLWLTLADGGTSRLTRFDPSAGTFDLDVRIPDATTSAVLVGDRLWLADRRGELLAVDTATGERYETAAGFPKGDTILDDDPSLFTGADRTLWALDQPTQTVHQLDPVTGAVIASAQLRDRPSSMAVTTTELVFANQFDDTVAVLARAELVPAP